MRSNHVRAVRFCAALGLLFSAAASAQDTAAHSTSPPPPDTTAEETFDILEYRILGVSRLAADDIERAVYPFLGPNKSIKTVEEARVKLEERYRAAGYGTVFVDIPEQAVADGIVRLRVTEGRIDRVRIVGARYYSVGRIRARLPALTRGEVPSLPQVQRELTALNSETRDRVITPVLKAGRTPGTVDVELKVEDRLPLHGSLEVNDRYTADTSRTRLQANLSYDNLFQRHDSLSVQYQTSPEATEQARVSAATYLTRLGDTGRLLAVYGVDTDSDVATLGALSVLGKGRIFGARLVQPIPGTDARYSSFSIGADYKEFDEDLRISSDTGLKTPISYLAFNAAFNSSWRGAASSLSFGLSGTLGLRRILNSSQEFKDKRGFGRPNFLQLRANVQGDRALFGGWRIFGKLAGQFADQALISNEQFAIGGQDTVRGYLESELLGDQGFAGSVELRTFDFGRRVGERISSWYGYLFYDAGVIRIVDALSQQASAADLASIGAGTQFTGFGGLSARLDWGLPLVPGSRTLDDDSRVHFGVRYEF